MNALHSFHPAVAAWFTRTFDAPTPAQELAWPAIQQGRDVLVAAPTGSGKTLAAFLAAIDHLVKEGSAGPLPDETRVLYVSPLKALSNDIHRNLEAPLKGIREALAALDLPDVEIRTAVRTGDTSQAERVRMRKQAPHILVTTPESLYVLLGSESGRTMLSTCRTVIVDEIHAVAGNKRGAHLALSLERLRALTTQPFVRVGLSATQTPIEEVAKILERRECRRARVHHCRQRPRAQSRPGAGTAADAAGARDVGRSVDAGVRPAGRAGTRASHHVGVRQHAAARRASGAPLVRAHRRGIRGRASWQPCQGAALQGGAAIKARRVEGAGGHGVAGTGLGHRRCGSGLPDRLDPVHQHLPAARGTRRPCGGGHLEGALVSACRATNWWSARRCCMR
jgi:ATP-dependent helicase YprA (DUF1998 family)